jgi:hypothetical protein
MERMMEHVFMRVLVCLLFAVIALVLIRRKSKHTKSFILVQGQRGLADMQPYESAIAARGNSTAIAVNSNPIALAMSRPLLPLRHFCNCPERGSAESSLVHRNVICLKCRGHVAQKAMQRLPCYPANYI